MSAIDLIVIGGSAGALEPLMQILGALPNDIDVPIAIVLHVLPNHTSLVPALLQRISSRRVREAEDKEPIERGVVYVAPPNYHMLIERGGWIALSVDDPVQFSRPSIDVLFESAVDAYRARIAGVVLSGSNADGANGLARIAAAGGIAIIQDPLTAQHATMPQEAYSRATRAKPLSTEDIGPYLGEVAR